MLRTRITERFGLSYPIMSAPMAMHSGGRLAAAVSNAGGLGSFGGIHEQGPEWLREQLDYVHEHTDKPFAVGFITEFLQFFEESFALAVEGAPVIALSFGDPAPWLARAKEAGKTVICQVQTLEGARAAIDSGADMLVAQGNEAGGHTGTMNALPFLARVLENHPNVPVMAAGGVGSARSLAAVLAAGADGAWLGTAFLATPECVEVPDSYKQRIVESDGQDTVYTSVFDTLSGLPWPTGIAERVQRNRFEEEWHGREEELRERREELAPGNVEARKAGDWERAPVLMGQSSGSIGAVRPAAEVVRSICEEAERLLRERGSSLLG